jgi:hypothetical protein
MHAYALQRCDTEEEKAEARQTWLAAKHEHEGINGLLKQLKTEEQQTTRRT